MPLSFSPCRTSSAVCGAPNDEIDETDSPLSPPATATAATTAPSNSTTTMAAPTMSLSAGERFWGRVLACSGGGAVEVVVCHPCRGGGGTGTSASGVGTCAVSCMSLPQFGQNRLSSLNSCPQLPQ